MSNQPATPTSSSMRITKIHIRCSNDYDGKAETAQAWLYSVCLYLLVNQALYHDDDRKIAYVLSYMKKGLQNHLNPSRTHPTDHLNWHHQFVTVQMDPYPFSSIWDPPACSFLVHNPACDPHASLLEGTAWSHTRSCQQTVHFSFHLLVTVLSLGQNTRSRSDDLYLRRFPFHLVITSSLGQSLRSRSDNLYLWCFPFRWTIPFPILLLIVWLYSDTSTLSVTVEDPLTPFSPFSLTDCTMLSHFSFNDFVAIAFPDIAGDLDIQI